MPTHLDRLNPKQMSRVKMLKSEKDWARIEQVRKDLEAQVACAVRRAA